MTTFTKEQLHQIEAAAKEVLWPVVWSEKKARAHFSEKITPEVVLELARIALASLEAPSLPDETVDHRDEFEAAFPIPLHAERCGAGYCCTAYNAWDAHKFVNRWEGWKACRATMQGKAVSQDKLAFDNQVLSDLYHAQEKRLFKIAQRIKGPAFDKYAYSPSQAIDVLEAAIFGDSEVDRASMIAAAPQQEVQS
jgi:hypothetical protein